MVLAIAPAGDGQMIRTLAIGAIAALSASVLPNCVHAQQASCGGLRTDISSLDDGTLFYRTGVRFHGGGQAWQALPPSTQLNWGGPRYVQFIYIAKENWDRERSGIIAIKSGHYLVTNGHSGRSIPRTVYLRRPQRSEPDNGTCRPISSFHPRSVPATSYDRYHDLGGRIPAADLATFDNFHINYLGRGGVCKYSNNTDYDAPLRGDWRSNRSQFSFDPDIVTSGMNSQFAASFGVGGVSASTAAFADRRVEIRRYRTNGNRIACIPFSLNVLGAGFQLRINDLETGTQYSSYFVRGKEKSWQLTP
jgi:hypothetical protein